MKFRIRFAEQIVGVFVLLAVLGIAAALVLLGMNQRWFARDYAFWSRFNSGDGLSVGMALKLKGFEIGKVDRIRLGRDNMVEIDFHVYDTYYEKVRSGSVLELAVSPLGLGAGLIFHAGPGDGPPLPELSFIPSSDVEEGRLLLARQRAESQARGDPVTAILGQVEPVLVEIDRTVLSIRTLADNLNSSLMGQGPGPLAATLNEAAQTIQRINGLAAELEGIADNLEALSGGLREPTGLVQRLLDPKGSIATLLDDDNALYNQIQGSVEQLSGVIAQLNSFVRFVNTAQPQILSLLEQGRTTLDQGQEVLEAVKNNPLLRGGVPARREQQTTFQSYRDEDF